MQRPHREGALRKGVVAAAPDAHADGKAAQEHIHKAVSRARCNRKLRLKGARQLAPKCRLQLPGSFLVVRPAPGAFHLHLHCGSRIAQAGVVDGWLSRNPLSALAEC
jgi:hypothetical protein